MDDLLTAPIQRPNHIPCLDGLRALSICLVVGLHTLQRFSITHHVPTVAYILFGQGGLGVLIFFVISGFLITTLLLREFERMGTISLTSFYIRRGFRIIPPLYLCILVVSVLGFSRHLPGLDWAEVTLALTFTSNYLPHPAGGFWGFEHLWSLCVEEQFYVLWPATLVFFLLHSKAANKRRAAAVVTLVVIAAEPFLRVGSYLFLPKFHNPGMFHMLADGLMFGALGALLQGDAQFEAIVSRTTRWPWLLPVLLFFGSGALGMIYLNYWNLPGPVSWLGLIVVEAVSRTLSFRVASTMLIISARDNMLDLSMSVHGSVMPQQVPARERKGGCLRFYTQFGQEDYRDQTA